MGVTLLFFLISLIIFYFFKVTMYLLSTPTISIFNHVFEMTLTFDAIVCCSHFYSMTTFMHITCAACGFGARGTVDIELFVILSWWKSEMSSKEPTTKKKKKKKKKMRGRRESCPATNYVTSHFKWRIKLQNKPLQRVASLVCNSFS